MNFTVAFRKRFALPALAGVVLLLGLGACATPSNRRALYFPQDSPGPWHQFALRQAVAEDLGVPASALPRPTAPATVVTKPGATPAVGPAPVTPTVPAAGSLDPTGGRLPVPAR